MNDRHANAAASSSATPPAMPALPDGVGLSYEELAGRLAEKSRVIVSPDDPILMMVPLCNAFLEEEQKLMNLHKAALAQVMASSGQGVADVLGKPLTSSAASGLEHAMAEHRDTLQQHRSHVFWLSAIAVISALANAVVFVALFFLKN